MNALWFTFMILEESLSKLITFVSQQFETHDRQAIDYTPSDVWAV